jgi:hypothetical protein
MLKLMPEVQQVKNKNKDAIIESVFYATLITFGMADIFLNTTVILLNDLAANNLVHITKIIVSIGGIRIICELDNYYSSCYISLFVRTTVDGLEMT